MVKKPDDENFEVTELDDESLEDVAGGLTDNGNCEGTCTNSGNCTAGCACKPAV